MDGKHEEEITSTNDPLQIGQGIPSSSSHSPEVYPATGPRVVVPTDRSENSCRVDSNTPNRTRDGIHSRLECQYCADDGSYLFLERGPSVRVHEECKQIVVTGAFPRSHCENGVLVETIRDPEDAARMVFARYEDGRVAVFDSIRSGGRIFLPPDPTPSSFPSLSLPAGLLPCGEPPDMFQELGNAISKFVSLRQEQLWIVAAFVLASWFPDCFEAAPYLWVVGPLDSGKTKLLKVLRCLCRRGLIAGDLRSGSLYKLVDAWDPTLILDEVELGSCGASTELLRLLRTGSVPGVPAVRNGREFSTYGLKVVASRQPFGDAALSSRGVVISMLPSGEDTVPLDAVAMQQLEKEFQAKLCMFRFENYENVKKHSSSGRRLQLLSARMKQIGLALTAPFGEDHEAFYILRGILVERNHASWVDRCLEPEWLVAELLLELCHGEKRRSRISPCGIFVGDIATQVNRKMENEGESVRLSPKKVGLVLKSLGLQTSRLGRSGRGLTFSTTFEREVHGIAAQLGINQRGIPPYGDPACGSCENLRRYGRFDLL